MLKISEFARLTQMPIKTLHYYDDIDLLKPIRVDEWTGYRYYSAAQLPRLYRILALKALGLSLEQIGQLLDNDLSAEQIRGMLRLRHAEIQQRLHEEHARLDYVEAKLRLIEMEGKMSEYEVVLKHVPPLRVASLRGQAPSVEQLPPTLGPMFGEVTGYVMQQNGKFTNGPMTGITVYHTMGTEPLEVETALAIEDGVKPSERIQVHHLPPIEQAASVVHHGAFSGLGAAYDALARWLEANGYTVVGPSREINLQYDPAGDPNDYVTEIQFPVAKSQ